MLDQGSIAYVKCSTCRQHREIDLPALVTKMGRDYSLWNRRCRCRLTLGCLGWNCFQIGPGWPAPLYDLDTEARWINEGLSRSASIPQDPLAFAVKLAGPKGWLP